MRYQPKEKAKYNIYCPLEPKCVNSVVGVGCLGFFCFVLVFLGGWGGSGGVVQ